MAGGKGTPDPALVAKLLDMNVAEAAGTRLSKSSPWAKDGGAKAGAIDARALPSAAGPKGEAAPKAVAPKAAEAKAAEAKAAAPVSRRRAVRTWMVLAAVGAVALPVLVTIVVMRAEMREMLTARPAADVTPSAVVGTTAGPRVAATGSASATVSASASAAVTSSASASVSAVPKLVPRPRMTADAAPPSAPPPDAGSAEPPPLPKFVQ